MTQQNYTHIIFVLDRSGSMQSVQDDTIGGFNKFLEDQRSVPGKATVTTILFNAGVTYQQRNNVYHTRGACRLPAVVANVDCWPAGGWYLKPHNFVDVNDVPQLSHETYQPAGGTALLDACRRAIEEEGQQLAAMHESQRPSQVICVIMTDGQENMSQKTTREQLQNIVKHQREVYSWEFVFLGANQDAFAEATSFGVHAGNAINYTSSGDGTRSAFGSLSRSMKAYRSFGSSLSDSFFDGKANVP